MTNEELVALIQSGKRELEADLYNQNLPMIKKIALKFTYDADEPLEDLMQQAYFGLLEAAWRYDPARGCQFVTVAYTWIKQELRRYAATCGRMIRISDSERYLYYECRKASDYVARTYGREPTTAELAYMLNVPKRSILKMQQIMQETAVSSLDVPIGEDAEDTMGDMIAGAEDVESCVDRMHEQEQYEALHDELSRLEPAQSTLIRLRMHGLSVKQAGETMGLGDKEARALDYQTMAALRRNRTILKIGQELGIAE